MGSRWVNVIEKPLFNLSNNVISHIETYWIPQMVVFFTWNAFICKFALVSRIEKCKLPKFIENQGLKEVQNCGEHHIEVVWEQICIKLNFCATRMAYLPLFFNKK